MSTTTKTKEEKAVALLSEALTERYNQQEGIQRKGDRVILPESGGVREWIKVLEEYADQEEETVDTDCTFDVHPDDGLYALYKVIGDKFGSLMSTTSFTMFGPRPGEQQPINVGYGQTLVVPTGKTKIFGTLPLTLYVQPNFDSSSDVGGNLRVVFEHPRKWKPFVKDIEDSIREYLKNNSIFRGKAINSDFSFMAPLPFVPEERIVYSRAERAKLFGEVFAPIIATSQWRANGRTLKRGALLYGDYGTGKSLTIAYIQHLCMKNGWTFINLREGDDITRVLRFARRYQPAVVAVEDIDRAAGKLRTGRVNAVVNEFDGIVSKNDEVMVIMTTNSEGNIQKAMLRPGRIDTSIHMGVLDAQAVRLLVQNELKDANGNSVLVGELDEEELFAHAHGYTNAFIVESVKRAVGYSIARQYEEYGGNIPGDGIVSVTQADIINGMDGLRDQWNLMISDNTVKRDSLETAVVDVIKRAVAPIAAGMADLTQVVGLSEEGEEMSSEE